MEQFRLRNSDMAVKLVLLVLLATLWGASYSFIKLGVATVPPIILIAAPLSGPSLLFDHGAIG